MRAIATPVSHDINSVKDMDKHIEALTTMKDKLEAMATATGTPTPSAMEEVMLEKDVLIAAIKSEEQYQKDRIKRIQLPKAAVAKSSPAVPSCGLASASEPLVQ